MSRKVERNLQCHEAVNHLVNRINFLALDFDRTIIDIHTGGRFKGTITELSTHVRPIFTNLISKAYESGIKIAVVTFSPQTQHIAHVLEIHFPEFAHEIVIRGRDNSFHYEGNGMKHGKQPFMASAVEELHTKDSDISITKRTTLLVDDDSNNIRLALKDGVRGIVFDPDRSHLLLEDILDLP